MNWLQTVKWEAWAAIFTIASIVLPWMWHVARNVAWLPTIGRELQEMKEADKRHEATDKRHETRLTLHGQRILKHERRLKKHDAKIGEHETKIQAMKNHD